MKRQCLFTMGLVSAIMLAMSVTGAQTKTPARVDATPGTPFHMGLLPSPPGKPVAKPLVVRLSDENDKLTENDLPRQTLLTEYLPPVRQQGAQNSCAAWSAGYYAFSYAVARRMRLSPADVQKPEHQFSPAFLYGLRTREPKENNGMDRQGMSLAETSELLQNNGCATLAKLPYDARLDAPPNESVRHFARAFMQARQPSPEVRELQAADDADLVLVLKAYLASEQLPIVTGIDVYEYFANLTGRQSPGPDYVYHKSDGHLLLGGHAITIVGYDLDKKAFRIVNSWGPEWGDHGFLWLSDAFVREMVLRFRVVLVRPSGPIRLGNGLETLVLRGKNKTELKK